MWVDEYHWHYDYARLAWDTGFSFDKYKYPNLDKNKICLLDIDRIIKERDVASVDRNISTVVQYVLENDQAEVLDTNFVKLFRLSQLSVEYLLFCKKYLDRTVVLLKKEVIKLKEETKELKIYTEDLETHINSSRNLPLVTFKCEVCSKIFASEDYLNSHLKRRHNGEENTLTTTNSEAEKLHSEIKQLKERLNNTEKYIQEKPYDKEVDNNFKSQFIKEDKDNDDKTTKLATEIQGSFEKFRKQVEEKMSSLQSEKNFLTDKYDKLFEIVLQYKHKEQESPKNDEKKTQERIESTTQTNESDTKKDKVKQLQVYTVHHDIGDVGKEQSESKLKLEENVDEKIEKKLSNFEESIETKISAGLGNIENQIQAFWQKLSEVEINHSKIGDHPVKSTIQQISSCSSSPQNKPKIKPRTKLTKPSTKPSETQANLNAERVKNELEKFLANQEKCEVDEAKPQSAKSQVKFEAKPDLKPTRVKSAMYRSSTEDEDNEDYSDFENLNVVETIKDVKKIQNLPIAEKSHFKIGESISKKSLEKLKPIVVVKTKTPKTTVPIKKKVGLKKSDTKDIERLKKKIRVQLNESVHGTLQEMGMSPSWKGVPKKTYERALEIVHHRALLTKKSLPNYNSIKRSIEKLLKNKEEQRGKDKDQNKVIKSLDNIKKTPKKNVLKGQLIKRTMPEPESNSSVVTIKNKAIYETSDSETDLRAYLPKNFDQKAIESAAVIDELQTKFSKRKISESDSISDLNSMVLSSENKEEVKETKSALKTGTMEGTMVKKKVFFEDLNDKKEKEYNKDANKKDKNRDSSFSDFEIE